MLLASQFGETTSRARSALNNPAKAKTVTEVKRQKGDAGAVLDLAPKSRDGVGPASSIRWGGGMRKKGEEDNLKFQPHRAVVLLLSESAANQHGRVSVFSPAVMTCHSLRPKSGGRKGQKPVSDGFRLR